MGFLKNAIQSLAFPTSSRTTGILVILLIIAAIPLTVAISKQRQEIRQRAAEPQSIPSSECRPPYSGPMGCLPLKVCNDSSLISSDVPCTDGAGNKGVWCYQSTKKGQVCSVGGIGSGACDDNGNCVIPVVPTPTPIPLAPTNTPIPPQPPTPTTAIAPTVCLGTPQSPENTTIGKSCKTSNGLYGQCNGRGACVAQSATPTHIPSTGLTGYDCAINKEPPEFYCSVTRPDVPNKERCKALLTKIAGTDELLTTCADIDLDPKALCWQCPPITPTPSPTPIKAECNDEVCRARGDICVPNKTACIQDPASATKSCKCLPVSILTPTQPPAPTAAPAPAGVALELSLTLQGIGQNRSLPSSVAKSSATIEILSHTADAENADAENIVLTKKDAVVYNASKGKFERRIDLGNQLAKGDYQVKIKVDNYLKKQVLAIFNVLPESERKTTQIIPVETTLSAGNLNTSNESATTVDILDYNAVKGCFGTKRSTPECLFKTSADLDFSGAVDIIDLNIVLRNFGKTDD